MISRKRKYSNNVKLLHGGYKLSFLLPVPSLIDEAVLESAMGSEQQRNLHRLVIVSFLLTSSVAADDQIRLAGSGSNNCSGRVEIFHNSTWGTVCDDHWDLDDAQVVCRQLGCGSALRAPREAHYGEGTGPIWLDDVGCSGSESSLTECTHPDVGTHNCGHGEDAGVVCSDGRIRLAGSGSNNCFGRVEIFHNSSWGTVCDDGWDLNDAQVVCRQLGCGPALSTPPSAHYGEGTGKIWLDDVGCSGSEISVIECTHPGFGTHNCGHSEDAGVFCSVPLLQPNISLTSPSGGLFWSPEGAEVTRGHSFLLTCSIAPQYPGGLFFLLFSGSRLNVSRPAVNHSASFSFPAAGPEQQGSYSCLYEVTLSSRTFTSTQEAPLTVIITFPVMVLVSSVCGGALLLVLLVLLVLGGVFFFFLIRWRRPADLNQTPMGLGAMKFNKEEDMQNIYVHFDGDETETG